MTTRAESGFDSISSGLYRLQRLLASRRVSSRLAEAAELDVSQQGMQVLRGLIDGKTRTVAEAAKVARMDVGAVSRQLRKLEDAQLVERATSADNASVVLVRLTTRGAELAKRLQHVNNRHLRDALAGWSADEREQLGELLVRLVDDLQRTPYRRAGASRGTTSGGTT